MGITVILKGRLIGQTEKVRKTIQTHGCKVEKQQPIVGNLIKLGYICDAKLNFNKTFDIALNLINCALMRREIDCLVLFSPTLLQPYQGRAVCQ